VYEHGFVWVFSFEHDERSLGMLRGV
jgi:hypothetical protein